MNNATERMIKARSGLVIAEPFFGTLAFKLELREDSKTKTSWTDGRTLGFNPEWATTLSMPELEGVFAHHILTCALGHQVRRNGRDASEWNDASDYVVNPELRRAGFTLPDGFLDDPQYEGMYVEEVYAAMQKAKQDKDDQPNDDNAQPQPGGDKSGQGEGGKPGDAQGQSSPSPQPGKGDDATGNVQDATNDVGDPADSAGLEEQKQDWQEAAAQAAQVARGWGKLPGTLEMSVEQFLNTKIEWREAIQRYFQSRSKDDYSWSRPNKRHIAAGIYLPELRSVKPGVLACAIDWSRSCIDRAAEFVSEIEEARSTVDPEQLILMIFDTQVRQVLVYERGEPVDLAAVKAHAGGGTSFDGPIRTLEEMEVTPEVLVFLTDLDSRTFGDEPAYPVLWISTDKEDAPFGDVIKME